MECVFQIITSNAVCQKTLSAISGRLLDSFYTKKKPKIEIFFSDPPISHAIYILDVMLSNINYI